MYKNPATIFFALTVLASIPAVAQQSRIAGRIDNNQRVTLTGHIHPKAVAGTDQGPVDPSFVMPRVTLMMQPTPGQQADLEELLQQQQDPSSANYHHWLTPEQFADRFGVSQADMTQIKAWLASQNLQVMGTARARNWIAVSGSADAVRQAFGLEIHHYLVNGELHYANANEPSIPASLRGIVTGFRGLTDFRLKPVPHLKIRRSAPVTPQYTSANLCGNYCIGPDDLATIYDLTPLFNAGLNGSGQTIVVVGQTDLLPQDINQYRTFFNLPPINLQQTLVPGSPDPGISNGDLGESDLDIEIAGAVARNATIHFVYSSDVFTSLQYAIDQNLAPIITTSYGDCEASFAQADALSMRQSAQQANTEGITWFAASGDSGATDCYGDATNQDFVVSVDMPASIPEVTGIGGTQLSEGSGKYWNATNDASNASALSYIPEIAWNTSVADASPSASGGGASVYFTKPSWQAGNGVPSDGARDVPDISISASNDNDPYLIFTSDPSSCGTSRRQGLQLCEAEVGGTSVGGPAYAGLAALLNQAMLSKGIQSSPGLGNINPTLYGLFQSTPSVYHDITAGDNIINVSCARLQRGCTAGPVGFTTGPGYDQVTGIGSVDANALVTAWLETLSQRIAPSGAPSITGMTNNGSYKQVYAPGEIVSIFGSNLASAVQSAASLPLPAQLAGVTVTIDGTPAPLWYISPTQLNVQIPYAVPTNTTANLVLSSNGQSSSFTFPVAGAAPGIYVDQQNAPVPYSSASHNQTITLYFTGAGAVSPLPADGTAPAAGTTPVPVLNVTVTVGGVTAPSTAVIPSWSTGIVQVNYQVPANAPLGAQPVVVTVGGVASNAATLTVMQ